MNANFQKCIFYARRLIHLLKGAGILIEPFGPFGSYTSLIGFNTRRLKTPKGDDLPRNEP